MVLDWMVRFLTWKEVVMVVVFSLLLEGMLKGRKLESVSMVMVVLLSGLLMLGEESVLGYVLMVDIGSLVIVLLSSRVFPLGYFMMQAWISGLLWMGMGFGLGIGPIVLLKCGAGMMLCWLFGLYSGLLWLSGGLMVLVSMLTYFTGWLSTLFLLSDGTCGFLLVLFGLALLSMELFDLRSSSLVLLGLGVSSSVLLSTLALVGAGLSWLYVLSSFLLVSVLALCLDVILVEDVGMEGV